MPLMKLSGCRHLGWPSSEIQSCGLTLEKPSSRRVSNDCEKTAAEGLSRLQTSAVLLASGFEPRLWRITRAQGIREELVTVLRSPAMGWGS
jgi:hypothetical protein